MHRTLLSSYRPLKFILIENFSLFMTSAPSNPWIVLLSVSFKFLSKFSHALQPHKVSMRKNPLWWYSANRNEHYLFVDLYALLNICHWYQCCQLTERGEGSSLQNSLFSDRHLCGRILCVFVITILTALSFCTPFFQDDNNFTVIRKLLHVNDWRHPFSHSHLFPRDDHEQTMRCSPSELWLFVSISLSTNVLGPFGLPLRNSSKACLTKTMR